MSDVLKSMIERLDQAALTHRENNMYLSGRQPLAFISAKSRAALDNRVRRIASDIPSLAVNCLSDRLRLNGFESDSDPWTLYLENDMDQLAPILHKEALALGQAFALVWASPIDGTPRVTIESAEQCAVRRNPISREVEVGIKRVVDGKQTHCWLYFPDVVQYWRADTPNGNTFDLIEEHDNPLLAVPLVPFTNTDRLLDVDGRSEIEPLKCLVDGLNATLAGLAVAVESVSLPRRWATGLELREEVVTDPVTGEPVIGEDGEPQMRLINPIAEGDRMAVSSDEQTKFGNWDAADLTGYRTAVDIWLSQIEAVSSIPSSMLGVLHNQPPTAEAMRASSTALTSKAESKALSFGRSHEMVAKLLVALRDGVDPRSVRVRAVWGDPSVSSTAQEADAAVKLYQSKVLSRKATLTRMGYTQDEIDAEIEALEADASAARDIAMGAWAG
ncbi:hypothetical protein BH10ACT9_BH10ACT9_35520 [soil metagenome]